MLSLIVGLCAPAAAFAPAQDVWSEAEPNRVAEGLEHRREGAGLLRVEGYAGQRFPRRGVFE